MTDRFISGLYDESFEKDACGIGLVARPDGTATRAVVAYALEVLKNLEHRGAAGADARTGDGAGLMARIPKAYLLEQAGLRPNSGLEKVATGMIFLSRDPVLQEEQEGHFARLAAAAGFQVLGWRTVPTDSTRLGPLALALEPMIRQVFLEAAEPSEHALFLLRKKAEAELRKQEGTRDPRTGQQLSQFYVCSLSFHTIVYKALVLSEELGLYFKDLSHEEFESNFALVHSRFSTNTLPAWELAHPFRRICHNGEINTIRGNRKWMKARESHLPDQAPFLSGGSSDSASLDQAIDLLCQNGRSLPEALMTLIPQAWETDPLIPEELKAFYRYQAARSEPWDGPAAVCFADGRYVGATLDRSGLRPCRYSVLNDGTLVLGSEMGALRVEPGRIARRGRLGPGEMIVVDFERGVIVENAPLKARVAAEFPYAKWCDKERLELSVEPENERPQVHELRVREQLSFFDYTVEEISMVLGPMFVSGEEPNSSMGNDTPLAVLSEHPQLLYRYFRQLFAQVTNPPIDPIRERTVFSLTTRLGAKPDCFHPGPAARKYLTLSQPVLKTREFDSLFSMAPAFRATRLSITCQRNQSFESRLQELVADAVIAASGGADLIVLSDRDASASQIAIPALLATGAVHSALTREGLRTRVSLLVDTGEARDVHQIACLLGYGAEAVHPYLVFDLVRAKGLREIAIDNYISAIGKALLTVISKMGITVLQSYTGAQVFEALGLAGDFVAEYFGATPSRIGGLGLREIEREARLRHERATKHLEKEFSHWGHPSFGEIHFRSGGETHFWNPGTISSLQAAAKERDERSFRKFTEQANGLSAGTLRGQLDFRAVKAPVPLEEVESAASLVKRMTTGAMSLGSLSPEAHETLALAMNRIGGKSNSGEGGEGAERFTPDIAGHLKNSAIKQIASGRFGVTAHYLSSASEIQIKIAQGAKPGEGGKLPGYKVTAEIAKLRYSIPGVTLISPPPHHDIYSIEDLKQLIFDLKKVNPRAMISVKLVASAGIGTIAAGVAKAGADKILVSCAGGGTGASPLSSIKYAGAPWELGLAEVHQTLVMQGLRSRVLLEADGQMKTGRDVAVAALLGAEEFGFSTAPLIVEGCIMMRKCHLNTCPVGVATQDPALRKKFAGAPEHVVNYFFLVAEDLRKIMAELGFRTLREMTGQRNALGCKPSGSWKSAFLDLAPLLVMPESVIPGVPTELRYQSAKERAAQDLDRFLLEAYRSVPFTGKSAHVRLKVYNTDHAIGTGLSGVVAVEHGAEGLPPDTVKADLVGTAGQSLGAFLSPGITLQLHGEANDFVGKGLCGGRVLVAQPGVLESESEIIVGNACLYGATSGELFVKGKAGERFAVRNSGATAVVEGVGDHACEYMTGGRVVILGTTGRNFGAGMSGGRAFVFDEGKALKHRLGSSELVLSPLELDAGLEEEIHYLLKRYALETRSLSAAELLADWEQMVRYFLVATPVEYLKALEASRPRKTRKNLFREMVANG